MSEAKRLSAEELIELHSSCKNQLHNDHLVLRLLATIEARDREIAELKGKLYEKQYAIVAQKAILLACKNACDPNSCDLPSEIVRRTVGNYLAIIGRLVEALKESRKHLRTDNEYTTDDHESYHKAISMGSELLTSPEVQAALERIKL